MNAIRPFLLAAAVLAPATLSPAALPRPAAAAELTCVGTHGFGVTCARDGGWKTYTKAGGALASDVVYDITACRGRLLVAAGDAVHSFDGARWSPPNRLPKGLPRKISCAPDDGYWVAAGTLAFRWTGKAWAEIDTGQILADQRPKYVNDLAAAPGGSAWIVFGGRLAARFDAQGWTVYRDGDGFTERLYLSHVHVGRDGAVWLPHPAGVTRYLHGKWTTFAGPGRATAVAEGPGGAIWLVDRAHLTRFKGGVWQQWPLDHRGHAVAVSADGRAWVATDFGLAVLNGDRWSWRRMHDSGLAANQLTAVAVLGSGAALPRVEAKPPGALTGRFVREGGQPLSGARVEICATPPDLATTPTRAAPCAGRPLLRAATTDDDGRFAISGLPPATYYLSVLPKQGRRWLVSFDARRTRVEAGQRRDSGTWRLHAAPPPG